MDRKPDFFTTLDAFSGKLGEVYGNSGSWDLNNKLMTLAVNTLQKSAVPFERNLGFKIMNSFKKFSNDGMKSIISLLSWVDDCPNSYAAFMKHLKKGSGDYPATMRVYCKNQDFGPTFNKIMGDPKSPNTVELLRFIIGNFIDRFQMIIPEFNNFENNEEYDDEWQQSFRNHSIFFHSLLMLFNEEEFQKEEPQKEELQKEETSPSLAKKLVPSGEPQKKIQPRLRVENVSYSETLQRTDPEVKKNPRQVDPVMKKNPRQTDPEVKKIPRETLLSTQTEGPLIEKTREPLFINVNRFSDGKFIEEYISNSLLKNLETKGKPQNGELGIFKGGHFKDGKIEIGLILAIQDDVEKMNKVTVLPLDNDVFFTKEEYDAMVTHIKTDGFVQFNDQKLVFTVIRNSATINDVSVCLSSFKDI